MLHKSCAVFSDGRTVLLLTPGTGNMQARLRHKRRDTIRRRRQVTKLPGPIPQYPPFSQRYRFLRMHCCVLALPMPSYQGGARPSMRSWTNDERYVLLSRRPSFAGCLRIGSYTAAARCLHIGYERGFSSLFVKVQRLHGDQWHNKTMILSSIESSLP